MKHLREDLRQLVEAVTPPDLDGWTVIDVVQSLDDWGLLDRAALAGFCAGLTAGRKADIPAPPT